LKPKLQELDVDFIGGQDKPLTKEEQLAISAFIKKLKEEKNKKIRRKPPGRGKQLA
jgi:cytochrome c1